MTHLNKKTIKKTARHMTGMVVAGTLLVCLSGCHSSDSSSASGDTTIPKPTAQSKAESISAVQNNPNIPPEAKAHITAQIQGTAPPPIEARTAKP